MIEDTDRAHARTTFWQMISFGCGTEIDRQNNRRLTAWCLAWALAVIAATWVVTTFDGLPRAAAVAIALAPNAFALAALRSYLRFLRMTDELQRRIQIEGLAIGFGITFVFAIGYLVLQSAGLPSLPLAAMILVMSGGWIAGNVVAMRHYE